MTTFIEFTDQHNKTIMVNLDVIQTVQAHTDNRIRLTLISGVDVWLTGDYETVRARIAAGLVG